MEAHEVRTVVIWNLDEKPGYRGTQNALYAMECTIMLLGDARKSLEALIRFVEPEDLCGALGSA